MKGANICAYAQKGLMEKCTSYTQTRVHSTSSQFSYFEKASYFSYVEKSNLKPVSTSVTLRKSCKQFSVFLTVKVLYDHKLNNK